MANRIQLRRDGAQQWANVNPILAQGELGIELDTSRLKIGDGVTQWNSLKYERPLEADSNIANTLVKRDADGNFEAGAITGTLIGNAATATRLANARNFTLTGDMSGSASFDGSANINITAELNFQPGLPHYDPNDLDAQATYTRLTIDSRGRVVTGDNPSTLAAFGIVDAQSLDSNLTAITAISTIGMLTRTGSGTYATRSVTGAPGRILTSNANGQSGNPLVDLADTPVVVGSYNPTGSVSLDQPETSVAESNSIHQTVNTTDFTVDRYGRLTYAVTAPISTAREGTLSPLYDNATAYSRFDKVKNAADRLYEAILDISAGGGEPAHTDTSDTNSWRYLGSALTPQKGLASFDQEDFDVTVWDEAGGIQGGYVTIAQRGVDNLQLQNNRIGFADGNTVENFELDQELTATTGYRGFNYLNYLKVNDTSGNLLVGANNTGDSGAGELDVNVRSYFSDPDITLDGALNQTLDKTGDGNLTFQHTQNNAADRTLLINATNAGGGDALINITSENDITISATHVDNRVNVEDYHFQDNVLSTTNATMVLDPNDDDDVTGLVQIRGDLQVDGTTTTVNSVTTTIQDPILTLGGEDTLTLDDNLDRGVEFRYYDTQERFGFFGWDEDYANSNIWNGTGGYRFLYNATNTNEVFAGTDAALIAGNLRLTTNTGSTSTTTGTLVVTGGVGISENVYVGGTVDIANDFDINSGEFTVTAANGNIYTQGDLQVDSNVTLGNASTDTVLVNSDTTFEDDVRVVGPNTVFSITDGTAEKFVIDSDNGNIHSDGTLDIDSGVTFNSTLDVDAAVTFNSTLDVDDDSVFHNDITLDTTGKYFKITNGTTDKFTVLSTNGNTDIRGTVDVGSAVHFETTLQVDGNITLGDGSNRTLTINSDTTFTDDLTVNATVDFDSSLNVDGTVDFNSTLVVDGQTTIYDSVILQSNNEVFNINNGAAQTQFSIDFDNGNTIIGRVGQSTGTLTVHGDSEFNDQATFTDNVTIGNANTDILTVNSVSQFTDNVTVDGDLLVNTNATVEGNLTVNGVTTTVNSTVVTLDDPIITLGGDTAPTTNDAKDRGVEFRYYDSQARLGFFGWDISASRYALYHAATNSSEAFSGTRSGLDLGSIKCFDVTNATNSATGALIVGGGAGIGLDLYVGDDLVVADDGSFGGDVDITGTLDVTDDFAVSTTFTVDAQTGNTFVAGTFGVNGNVTLGNASSDSHVINGTVQYNDELTFVKRANIRNLKVATDAANEISTSSGNLILDSAGGTVNITDNADVDGDLNVDGNTQIDGTITVDGNATIGNQAGDNHIVTGTVTFNQAITSTDITADAIQIGVDADNEISTTTGNLILDSAGGKVHITDNAEIDGFLQVDGNTTLGDSNVDTLTVNATSTFNASITSQQITANNLKVGVDGNGEISTTSGALTLDSDNGETIIDDNASVSGTLDVTGVTTITDNLTINAASRTVSIQNGSAANKFTVATDTGNTLIEGTLSVNGTTVIDDTLNVTQGVDFDSTLNIDGVTTLTNTDNASTGNTFAASGALQVAGGLSVAQDLAVGGDIQIYGDFEVDGNVVQKGNQEFRGRVDFTKNENPGSLSANAPIMIPNGGLTVAEDTFIGQSLFLGPNAGTTITLDGVNGNADINGTLDVNGLTTLGQANISTITTTGAVNIGGTATVGANKFVINSASGNTDIVGTVDIGGVTNITNTLGVTQAVDFDSTLNVDGETTLNDALTQNSTSLFKDNVVLRGASKTLTLQNGSGTDKITLASTTGNVTAAGLTTTNTLDVTSNTTIGGTLGVTGQITGDVTGDLTGTSDKSNLADITDTTTSNLTYFPTFVSTNNGFTEIRTDSTNLTYNPSTNRLTVANFRSTTDFEVQGNLNITGTLTFGQSQVGSIANHDTDALTEGTSNLYFTDERVDDRVNALITGGTGITATYDDAGNILTLSATQGDINTDNITEGSTALFTTAARTRSHFTYGTGITHSSGTLSVTQSDINTDNVTEGSTNIFFTNARARGAFSAGGDLSYNAGTGAFSVTTYKTADARGDVSAAGDLSYNSGTGVFSYSTPDSDGITEGSTNLYHTAGRVDTRIALQVGANLDLSSKSTVDLAEDTNLYYTEARADARVTAGITALGLGTAATTDATAYATAAQGTLAASATQPGDLGAVATSNDYDDLTNLPTLFSGAYADLTGKPTLFSGAYADLTGKPTLFSGAYGDLTGLPTLGTAAATASTDYATAAQGATADSALQAETITLATLKATVAASADFADFQTRIAAL
nr:structural protein [uncultured Mediterranean phage uvMED]